MKHVLSFLGKSIGIHFAPDNHVVPVLRLEQYHRVEGPGFFWIKPLLERTLSPIKTSLYVGNYSFAEVLSQDNIPFDIQVSILFTFNPRSTTKTTAAMLVRSDEATLKLIVKEYANQHLRRLISRFRAEQLNRDTTLSGVEYDLAKWLKTELAALGIAPLPSGGVLIKETSPPEQFKRTMLDVNHDRALLKLLSSQHVPDLAQQLYQVIFANSLKERSGDLVVMSSPEQLKQFPQAKQKSLYQVNGNK